MKKRKFTSLAKSFLREFGNDTPNQEQVSKMEYMLTNVTTLCSLKFYKKLSERETQCLLLAAHGKSTFEIAALLKIKTPTVDTHRREILKKLNCKSMTQAVFQTMRYNIFPNLESPYYTDI